MQRFFPVLFLALPCLLLSDAASVNPTSTLRAITQKNQTAPDAHKIVPGKDEPVVPTLPPQPSPSPTTTVAPTTTAAPFVPDRKFDTASFIGGFVLCAGLSAIGFVSWKFYKARVELTYRTL